MFKEYVEELLTLARERNIPEYVINASLCGIVLSREIMQKYNII